MSKKGKNAQRKQPMQSFRRQSRGLFLLSMIRVGGYLSTTLMSLSNLCRLLLVTNFDLSKPVERRWQSWEKRRLEVS